MKPLIFKNRKLYYLDQTCLPSRMIYRPCRNLDDACRAIRELQVRGAPLLGVFVAYCLYVAVSSPRVKSIAQLLTRLDSAAVRLKRLRPTAVNISWSLERVCRRVYGSKDKSVERLKGIILQEAKKIHTEDIALCKRIAGFGTGLIRPGWRILTHCNAGFLATSGEGTALAVIYEAHRRYHNISVYVDETRPLLQGARLTAWELAKKNVPFRVICDNMAAYLIGQGKIDAVLVGADRIAANGDAANKIGTYNLAIVSHYHGIPFYIAAPSSSFDLSLREGEHIPIEQRRPEEIKTVLGKVMITPRNAKVENPAFDVTPARLISAIITEKGVLYQPFRQNIRKAFRNREKV